MRTCKTMVPTRCSDEQPRLVSGLLAVCFSADVTFSNILLHSYAAVKLLHTAVQSDLHFCFKIHLYLYCECVYFAVVLPLPFFD